jgi:peptidoglycan/xylan/chitin deacetylase (PgdA/CDA1 family)
MKSLLTLMLFLSMSSVAAEAIVASGMPPPVIAQRSLALTLDVCSGKFDLELIRFLVQRHLPATFFATNEWLTHNPKGQDILESHPDLFTLETHAETHVPASIHADRKIYGIADHPDIIYLRRELSANAAINAAIGVAPHWYDGATAQQDGQSIAAIEKMNYKMADFLVHSADATTAKKLTIEKRLAHIKAGDIIIAHMNKPASDTAEGLAVGLAHLLEQGFVFVRLDQIELEQIK